MKPLIETDHLYRYYGDFCAVNDLSLTLNQGEVLGFLGPNGAGKSTTMQIISGVLAPSHGKVTIDGIDLQTNPIQAKSRLGYLPETPPLHRELTVDEYLRYCGKIHGIARKEIKPAVDRAKSRCGLADSGQRLIANLSKGYQQRTGLAQAIIHSPRVVILDEPTSGLDPNQMQDIRQLIRELGQDHGVLISTHILPEVEAVCDRVVIINEGQSVYTNPLNTTTESEQQALIVVLSGEPESSDLKKLPGIHSVQQLEPGRYRLEITPETAIEQLAEQLVQNHWGLRELRRSHQSLEQIFTRLTTTPNQIREGEAA
ncbi:MAG: ATP-binding cassette domain-containing protein [Gammaproteobacteria bacterium]|nr:ATP-binding cassette domain-containing protein [Gammaproteobacteria bacterium]